MQERRKHSVIDYIGFAVVSVLIISAISSCQPTCYDGEQNQDETNIDCGGGCVPCDTTLGTCFDGLLNQGEEGVDCGGPCNTCITDTTILSPTFICTGTGGSSYFPLSLNSYWIYSLPSNGWFQLEIIATTTLNNGEDYFQMETTGSFGTIQDYFREVNGQIFRWNSAMSLEEIYIPANPTVGLQWSTAATDSIIVESTTATLSSQNGCSYDGLLQITSYTNNVGSTNYYKQGLGLIQLVNAQAYLDSAVVY